MQDTDFTFVLTDKIKIPVIYPHRVGIEYDTPTERFPTRRIWNVDVQETIENANFYRMYDPRFIVGKWGTGAGEKLEIVYSIPFILVNGIEDLTPQQKEQSEKARAEYKKNEELKHKANIPVTRMEFDALEQRVSDLEGKW